MHVHYRFDTFSDAEVCTLSCKECSYCNLVCRIHDTRKRASLHASCPGKGEAFERFGIRLCKLKRAELCEIEWLYRSIPALGITERILDWYTHVSCAEMGLHASVRELDHGMDCALRLHDDTDLVIRHIEEMMRFDNLKTFVHQRRGVDGDLGAHIPRGMSERLLGSDPLQLITFLASERTTRGRYP